MNWIQQIQLTTQSVVFKVDDNFPETIKSGGDVDMLVGNLNRAVEAIRASTPNHADIRVVRLGDTQTHVDYMRSDKILVRMDLYEQFNFDLEPKDVFADARDIVRLGMTVKISSLQHECQIRWMEWKQWHQRRPDKKKHLIWNRDHGCAPRYVTQRGASDAR
jgi:hypothetical protein